MRFLNRNREPEKRRRGKNKVYSFIESFDSLDLAQSFLKDHEYQWNYFKKNPSTEGNKIVYHCSNKSCEVKAYVLCHNDSLKASLFVSDDEHQHTNMVHGLSEDIKNEIEKLYRAGVKRPNAIISSLDKEKQNFSKKQLENFLVRHKKKIYGDFKISVGELKQYIDSNSIVPENDHQVFVGNSQIESGEVGQILRIFFTTKYLMQLTRKADQLAVDATYKLVWQGYPVHMIGSTDIRHTIHSA